MFAEPVLVSCLALTSRGVRTPPGLSSDHTPPVVPITTFLRFCTHKMALTSSAASVIIMASEGVTNPAKRSGVSAGSGESPEKFSKLPD